MRWSSLSFAAIGAFALAYSVSASNSYGSYQEPGSCYTSPGNIIEVFFPLPNGFPNSAPGSPEDVNRAEEARGILPNVPPPPSVSTQTLTALRLTFQYHTFAVAAFTQILRYITDGKPGFYIGDSTLRDYVIATLQTRIAKSEQQAINNNYILVTYGQQPMAPCKYYLSPEITDFNTAAEFGGLFLLIFVGIEQSVALVHATAGDLGFIRDSVSITQDMAQTAGWLRSLNKMEPSMNPFPVGISLEYGLSTLYQQYLVPGSCPTSNTIDLASFEALIVVEEPLPCADVDQLVQFSIQANDARSISGYYIVYVTQQTLPIVVSIQDIQSEGGCVTFYAPFPCSLPTFGDGLTLAALINATGDFRDVNDLIPFTYGGPTYFYLT